MSNITDIFKSAVARPKTEDGVFAQNEVGLANRNSGNLLESLHHDTTPTGQHYLLIHFDVPDLDDATHQLVFGEGFESPYSLSMSEIRSLPQTTRPVTLECAGNGRTGISPRTHSMPWTYEAVGTSEWTGTLLAPLIQQACPHTDAVEIVFTGADRGFDKGVEHAFGRSLTIEQIASLDVLLVHTMNGQPLLPQHGAPLRIIVPGWYGMASVKWLSTIEATTQPYQGFQQVQTYRYRQDHQDPGQPVTSMRVKSLMTPPGIPDWTTRKRYVKPGIVDIVGRAWSGNGSAIKQVEFYDGDQWHTATTFPRRDKYDWTRWSYEWLAKSGERILSCRATDEQGNIQPLQARWDNSGFGNNAAQQVSVFVDG